MKLLIYEHMSATWRPGETRAASLFVEGSAMLTAAVADAARIPGAEVRTPLSDDLPVGNEDNAFQELCRWCDYALVIAPESDGILESLCRTAVECGATLLGPPPDVVALCADKLKLASVWHTAGVPTPVTVDGNGPFPCPPLIAKPRRGAGAVDTFVNYPFDIPADTIIQPYLPGQDMSMAFLIGRHQTIALRACTQDIVCREGRLHYRGGQTSSDSSINERVARIAGLAIAAVPALFGYVGVDVILRPDGDLAIEINPRLTTSYLGLRQVCRANVIELLVRLATADESMAEPTWRAKDVAFGPFPG